MQMMFKQAKFKTGYVAEVHTQVLELPYAGQELSMVVLLPDDNTELAVVSPGPCVCASVDTASAPVFMPVCQLARGDFPLEGFHESWVSSTSCVG